VLRVSWKTMVLFGRFINSTAGQGIDVGGFWWLRS
jgi:hypothetical protein